MLAPCWLRVLLGRAPGCPGADTTQGRCVGIGLCPPSLTLRRADRGSLKARTLDGVALVGGMWRLTRALGKGGLDPAVVLDAHALQRPSNQAGDMHLRDADAGRDLRLG